MSTGFAGQFEDDPKGAKTGDRVRISKGDHAGKFAIIDDELLAGYYVVTPVGETRPAVLEFDEFVPAVTPVLVAGLSEPPEEPTSEELGDWVAATVERLRGRITEDGPLDWAEDDTPDDGLAWVIGDLDEVIITAVETQMKLVRALFKLKRGEQL